MINKTIVILVSWKITLLRSEIKVFEGGQILFMGSVDVMSRNLIIIIKKKIDKLNENRKYSKPTFNKKEEYENKTKRVYVERIELKKLMNLKKTKKKRKNLYKLIGAFKRRKNSSHGWQAVHVGKEQVISFKDRNDNYNCKIMRITNNSKLYSPKIKNITYSLSWRY